MRCARVAPARKTCLITIRNVSPLWILSFALLLFLCVPNRAFADGFDLGTAANFGLLFEGNGGNTLQITNVTVNGNVGVGLTGQATDSGPSTISGALDFSAANTGQFSNNNAADIISGGVNYNVSPVTQALNTVNSLNATLGAESGTNVAIGTGTGKTLTINASAGVLDAFGNRVFTVTSFNTTNSNVLTINGSAGDYVVLNFTSSTNFNNQVVLTGGITADHVLYNFVGGSGLTGGPTLQINNNASGNNPPNIVLGVFLDPNGAISITNANVFGRVFGGDTHDFQYVSGSTITAPTSVPEPASAVLLGTGLISVAGFKRKRTVNKK